MCKRMKLRTSYDTKEPSTLYSNGGEGARWGLKGWGAGGVTPASRTLHTRIPPPLFLTLSLFLLQNIDHCCVIFPISLSSPAALSSPASRTPPAPFCPGRPPIHEWTVDYLLFR